MLLILTLTYLEASLHKHSMNIMHPWLYNLQFSFYILLFAGHIQMAQFNSWSPCEHSKTVSPFMPFNVFSDLFLIFCLLTSFHSWCLCHFFAECCIITWSKNVTKVQGQLFMPLILYLASVLRMGLR